MKIKRVQKCAGPRTVLLSVQPENALSEWRSSVTGHSGLVSPWWIFLVSCKNKICCYFYAAPLCTPVYSSPLAIHCTSIAQKTGHNNNIPSNLFVGIQDQLLLKVGISQPFSPGPEWDEIRIFNIMIIVAKMATVICIKGIVYWGNDWNNLTKFLYWKYKNMYLLLLPKHCNYGI